MMAENRVTVQLLMFAKARELTEISKDELVLPSSRLTTNDLLQCVLQKHPKLQLIVNNIVLAVNEEYVMDKNQVIQLNDGDEIAIIPPLSGG